jgi:glutamate-1-semialdehyde 2,1-aminomutase
VGSLEDAGTEPRLTIRTNAGTLSAPEPDAESARWRARCHSVIPGGSHTYAKGDDQFPANAPPFLVRGQGCRVWDGDGNEYIEYGMGLRTVTLGHGYEPVIEAAATQMRLGTNFSRPSPIELECAEALLELIPAADMVKFAKNGSDVTTAAVKLARAATGRDLVAVCRDHPFFSTDDWFIGTTTLPAGIPQTMRSLTVAFGYNDLGSVEALFRDHPGRIACVILEAERVEAPRDGFLRRLRDLCHANGVLFILDEMITGFRWHLGGAQAYYDLVPDLSTFGKAIANGFSVSALVGNRELMARGGLDYGADRVFLLSTTHGAETHGLAAALETIRIYRTHGVIATLWRQGDRLQRGVEAAVAELGLEACFALLGKPCNLIYSVCDAEGRPSQLFRTLFLQEMIRRGVLAPSFVVSYSHGDQEIDRTIEAARGALTVCRQALEEGIEKFLVGPSVQPVFPVAAPAGVR